MLVKNVFLHRTEDDSSYFFAKVSNEEVKLLFKKSN